MAFLTIVASPGLRDVPELRVMRGKEQVSAQLLGARVPVDSGETLIDVSAPGYVSDQTRAAIDGGAAREVQLPMLQPQPRQVVTAGSGRENDGRGLARRPLEEGTVGAVPGGLSTLQTVGLA